MHPVGIRVQGLGIYSIIIGYIGGLYRVYRVCRVYRLIRYIGLKV